MTDADEAFTAARAAIRDATLSGAEFLHFSDSKFSALRTIPHDIAGLTALRVLSLDDTDVTSLDPLQSLPALQSLTLDRSRVTDLAPLASFTALHSLSLDDTQVSDLRPIKDLPHLGSDFGREHLSSGLHFRRCRACSLDPDGLGRLSEIDDDEDRTRQTLQYLQNLTTWPPRRRDTNPEQDAALSVEPNPDEDGRLDVRPATPASVEAAERLKQTLYTRLKDALKDLITATGNQHYRITQRARDLQTSLPVDFANTDALHIYIELDWLRGLYANRTERAESLSDAALDALREIQSLGPGLVLDNAEVERLEDRRRRWTEPALSAEAAAAMDALSSSIAVDNAAFGKTLRIYEAAIISSVDAPDSRRNVVQRILNRNVLIAVGRWLADRAGAGIVGWASISAILWAASHQGVILSAAASYGETFTLWLSPLLAHAQQIAALTQGSGMTVLPPGPHLTYAQIY